MLKLNNKIKALTKKLESNHADAGEIEKGLQLELNKVFDKIKDIKKIVSELENSKDYVFNEFGEIDSWIRFDLRPFVGFKQYFTEYMMENHFVRVDWTNDVLTYSQGGAIVINDDGDVLETDSGKWIVSKNDYRYDGQLDLAKRNALIEAWMESTGYFPGVFRSDYHGNVFPVNTKEGL